MAITFDALHLIICNSLSTDQHQLLYRLASITLTLFVLSQAQKIERNIPFSRFLLISIFIMMSCFFQKHSLITYDSIQHLISYIAQISNAI
jgi:hypothetical protein